MFTPKWWPPVPVDGNLRTRHSKIKAKFDQRIVQLYIIRSRYALTVKELVVRCRSSPSGIRWWRAFNEIIQFHDHISPSVLECRIVTIETYEYIELHVNMVNCIFYRSTNSKAKHIRSTDTNIVWNNWWRNNEYQRCSAHRSIGLLRNGKWKIYYRDLLLWCPFAGCDNSEKVSFWVYMHTSMRVTSFNDDGTLNYDVNWRVA